MNKDTVIKAIQQGKTKAAINALKAIDLSKEKQQAVSIIEAEFNTLNQEILKGTIDTEERQLRLNRINDKLLTLVSEESPDALVKENRKKIGILLAAIGFIGLLFFVVRMTTADNVTCPEFKAASINKILLIPFENVGSKLSMPHVLLKDRIESLSLKKNLSTTIKLGEVQKGFSLEEAPVIAKSCGANVIIWGKYSNAADSLRLILQYHFLEQPDWSNMSDLITLKDVTDIQKGKMLKNLEDSIMSLCSIIAIRQDKQEVTKKWLGKVKEKEAVDLKLVEVLEGVQ